MLNNFCPLFGVRYLRGGGIHMYCSTGMCHSQDPDQASTSAPKVRGVLSGKVGIRMCGPEGSNFRLSGLRMTPHFFQKSGLDIGHILQIILNLGEKYPLVWESVVKNCTLRKKCKNFARFACILRNSAIFSAEMAKYPLNN